MPKIIENLEARLMEEAKLQINREGYGAMTIRSVAKACGVGVGTVYNYFPSKDALTAAFMLEDWQKCITIIQAVSDYSDSAKPVVRCIYDQLRSFGELHRAVFQDAAAIPGFSGSFSKYHVILRGQIAAPVRKFCPDEFSAEFIAEALLVWTMSGKEFDALYAMIEKLIKE